VFTKRVKLFNLFGFPLYLDLSWFIIAVLLMWSLARGYFPANYKGLAIHSYWLMGVIGAMALFASVVLHELGHALMARRFGVEMRGITLFIFGGVAEMANEPPSARAEFMVAIAGPLVSVFLSALFFLLSLPGPERIPIEAYGVMRYLALINFVLVAFNMVPAFPLDGGRVLRAILWHLKDNLNWATRITSQIGGGFGTMLMVLGVVWLFTSGDFIGAIWFFILGMFLRGASAMSYQQLIIRRALEGEQVRRFMRPNPITVPTDITLDEFVRDYVYRHHYKLYPVMDNGRLLGSISTKQLRGLPPETWPDHTVGEVYQRYSPDNVIEDTADVTEALAKMNNQGVSRMVVVHEGELAGILALKDLMNFLALKIELENPGGARGMMGRDDGEP